MEHNGGNQNLHSSTLCRTGCGFYANASFEGMCSKCYKDALKRRQQNTSPTQVSTGRVSPPASNVLDAAGFSETNTVSSIPISSIVTASTTTTTPSVETATPTVPSTSTSEKTTTDDKLEGAAAGGAEASTSAEGKDESGEKDKKPKKNRCHTCKKKVGLTGFQCRCGGLYCSMHRYSDKHDCTFDYKELGAQQIRKNNPVVVGQKIQKI